MSEATDQPLRWTLNKAAEEFGFARQTVKNLVIREGIAPDEDSTYSTRQIVAALFGDLERQKQRRAKAEADLAEMERDERAKELMAVTAVESVWLEALGELRNVVLSLDLPADARARVMASLREIPLHEYTKTQREEAAEEDAQ